jgi:signal transduction histidine kinase
MLVILVLYAAMTTRTFLQEVHRAQRVEVMSEQTLKLNKELMEADRLKTRFVSLASHQLRSPISGVRTYLTMFSQDAFGQVNDKQKKVLATNIEALGRLEETVETFLDAAKIQLGKLELFKTEGNVQTLVTRAVSELDPLAKKRGLVLTMEVAEALPPVSCDEGKIMHVLVNLIDNAIKYTKQGGVTVFAAKDGKDVLLKIQDTGVGLDPDDRSRIFEVFSRGMEAVRLDTGGSGLGLYIVKNILDAHGAPITVESEGRGKGSTFSFRLPIV